MNRILALLFLLAASPAAHACSACFGDPNSSLTKGANMGIAFLLVVIVSVLGGVAGFFVFLARRSRPSAEGADLHSVSPNYERDLK